MKIIEYRIILPLTISEYDVGQHHTTYEVVKEESNKDNNVEIIKKEVQKDGDKIVAFSDKVYYVGSILSTFFPQKSLKFREQCWDSYPTCKTEVKNEYFGSNFDIEINSIHLPDAGTTENPFNLPPRNYKNVEVVYIDIANDFDYPAKYKAKYDPSKFHSSKTGRGPLGKDWIKDIQAKTVEKPADQVPVMCCYKLVSCKFSYFGLQGRVEKMLQDYQKELIITFNRQLFCNIDKWFGLSKPEIDQIENTVEETKNQN